MNDKRCPVCDLLVDEQNPRCTCQFVFFDDTPKHVITRKRLVMTSLLLVLAVSTGLYLSRYSVGTSSFFPLKALSLAAFSLNLLPYIRKQGGVALSVAMVALLWTSFFCGRTWIEVNGVKRPALTVRQVVYAPGSVVNMGGQGVNSQKELGVPSRVEVVWNGDEVAYITGGSISQDGHELIRPGDTLGRVEVKFPQQSFSSGLLHLTQPESIYITENDNLVEQIYLIRGRTKHGDLPEIDGLRIGMSPNLARVIADLKEPRPKYFVGGHYNYRAVVGMQGTTFRNEDGLKVKKGQKKSDVPDLNTGRESPYVTVQYDPDDRVESICLVASTDDVFFPPILAANLAEEHNLKPGEHYVSKVDQQNQPVEMIETWNTVLGNPNSPKRVYLKRRPVKKTEVLAEPPYHRTSTAEGWSESSKKFGDQSMWIPNNQGGGCKLTFLYNGQFYEITTSHHEHFLTEVPKLGTDVLKTQKRLEVESR